MWRVARNAPFRLYWSMFVNKWSLLVDVTLDAGCVDAGGESGLFQFETAMRIVAVAALHRSFQHLMMERQIELVLGLTCGNQDTAAVRSFSATSDRMKPGFCAFAL